MAVIEQIKSSNAGRNSLLLERKLDLPNKVFVTRCGTR